ncbi:hypothetical protein Pan14r_49640 [Crateriforma conspicua]|uniref:Tetratricopeptide repeat protein n=2 Tax=Crateriforma conspicua TaxID=2527996 RepID=A0A5C5YC14_9PLAN|nr:hypothetical protein Pan14r_49640 [Crateriforma conspicua]
MGLVLAILFTMQIGGALVAGLPGLLVGTALYFAARFAPRRVKKLQKNGLQLMGEEKYSEAAEAFATAFQFFDDNRWYDRNRHFTLLDYSGLDWREMMLANCAACHALAGNKNLAKQLYRECLTLYPESRLAKPALLFLEPDNNG